MRIMDITELMVMRTCRAERSSEVLAALNSENGRAA